MILGSPTCIRIDLHLVIVISTCNTIAYTTAVFRLLTPNEAEDGTVRLQLYTRS